MEIWKKSLKSIFLIMEKMKENYTKQSSKTKVETDSIEAASVEEDSRLKLFRNFQELKDAFENNNREYFSI
jgi:hypothetical protein